MDAYNKMDEGGKGESDGFRESGKKEKPAPKFKDTYNPNESVPKLKQQDGAE